MPRSPKTEKVESKPYARDDDDVKQSPATKTKGGATKNVKKWSKQDKTDVLLKVIAASKPDWEAMAAEMGVTRSKIYDQWRHHIFPHIQRTGSVSGEGREVKSD